MADCAVRPDMACLELVSLSSLALEGARDSYDLIFDLSSEALPAFSAVECWRKRTCILPLRDRVMIEWLFSQSDEAVHILKVITETINKTVKETALLAHDVSETVQSRAPSTTISVAIGCQNGAQHSVCFVEQLYEQYLFESSLALDSVKMVDVKRQHHEATKGEFLNIKDVIWQYSRSAVKHIHVPHHRDLVTNGTAWSNFPLKLSRQIESAFLKDPFSASLDIGEHVINFERGTVYNKKSEEEFRIRSTIPSHDGKVLSSWLQDDEYRQLHKSYTSAGILFYSVHPRTGEPVFLLGHMTYGSLAWCDFGGLRKFIEKAKFTAARECYEETLGILGMTRDLVSMLENYEENNVFKIMNKGTRYVEHFLRVPYKDYPTMFKKALEGATDEIEVDEMRWFSLSCLKTGIQKALLDQYDNDVEPLNEDGSVDFAHLLPLRVELVDSLCVADQLGVLRSIESIAQTLHADSQLPLSPYVSYPKSRPTSKYQQSAELAVTLENASPKAVTALDHHLVQNVESLKLNGMSCSEKVEEKYQSCVGAGEKASLLEQTCQQCGQSDRLDSGHKSHGQNRTSLRLCTSSTGLELSSSILKEAAAMSEQLMD